MEKLIVKWNKKALEQFKSIAFWYSENMGLQAAIHFAEDTRKSVDILSRMPQIGKAELKYATKQTCYYSMLIHPKYRLIYRFTSTTLYVVAFRATMMKG